MHSKFKIGDTVLINSGGADQGRLATVEYVSSQNDSGDTGLNFYGIIIKGEPIPMVQVGYYEKELILVRK